MSLAFDPAWSLQDVQTHLGDIPFDRIRAFPSPGTATEEDYTEPNQSTLLHERDTLTGGDVLPGFTLGIHDWFERAKKRRTRG